MPIRSLVVGSVLCLCAAAHAAPPVMPEPVRRVFDRACKDCHSNRTDWPWYARLPPLSMAIAADVQKGRAAWNLSEWDTYSDGKKLGFLTAISTDAALDNMPPRAYRWLHSDSRLSASERRMLAEWALAERTSLRTPVPKASPGK